MSKLRVVDGGKGGAPPRNPRHMSLSQVATILDRDANTVRKWLGAGCPAVSRGDRGRGVAWVLDLAAVVRWLEEQSALRTASQIPAADDRPDGPDTSKEEADRRRAWAMALIAEDKLRVARGELIPRADARAVVAGDYADVRQALDGLPAKTAQDLAAMTDPQECMDYLHDEIRDALTGLVGNLDQTAEQREAVDVDADD